MRNVRILTASRIGASLLAFAVSACTVIPGSNLNRPLSMIGGQFSDDGSQVVQADIDFVRITPSTIRQLSDRKAMSASNQVQQQSSLEPYVYRIGIGDVLDITVWEDPGSFRTSNESIREKSGTLVHGDGTIYFPFVGVLPVVGKTTFEVRDEIRKSLSRVVTEPRVDVNIMLAGKCTGGCLQRLEFGLAAGPGDDKDSTRWHSVGGVPSAHQADHARIDSGPDAALGID